MKRIVVGLDATPAMAPVLNWVERFAADIGVHVDVVHVVPRSVLMAISSVQANSDAYLKNMQSQLERDVLRPLRALGISAAVHVERGDPAHELARFAQRRDADLIVIGGPDHSALHDVVVGGLARRLQHHADVPVVIVPLKPVRTHASP